MEKAVIIRYCEIHLKGKNRSFFEKLLRDNLKNTLKDIKLDFVPMHSRYVLKNFDEYDLPLIEEKLSKVPGVHTYSVALVVDNDFEMIYTACKKVCEDKEGTFKVIVNRADKTFSPGSVESSALLGGRLLHEPDFNNKLSVDVKNPSFIVNVDIREDGKTFVYTDTVYCISGMPVGSAGKGLLLISGGIDSPVAGYMTCKRGMHLDFLHFHSYPYTSEAAKNKVIDLANIVGEYNGGGNLYVVSFTRIQEEIHKNCPEEFMITLMRRFMMRIAERLSNKIYAQAIITGESLGQVASQTIESITSSNSVVTIPVLRPLIMFDKLDIIEISKKINAYETSILPYEDCCTVFLPKYPAIRPNLEKVLKAESKLDVEGLINEALENIEKIKL